MTVSPASNKKRQIKSIACVPDSVSMMCSGEASTPMWVKRREINCRSSGCPAGVAYSTSSKLFAFAMLRRARRIPVSYNHSGGNQPQPGLSVL